MGKQLCFTMICDNKLSGDLTNAKFVEYLFLTFCQFFLAKQDDAALSHGIQIVLIVKSEQMP